MHVVTGASGQLGRRIVTHLREHVDAGKIIALSRTPDKLADLGVQAHYGDLDQPESLLPHFGGAERVLVVATDAVGRRTAQHANAITAAQQAGVGGFLYTSMIRAGEPGNASPILFEHRETEQLLLNSGLPFTLLRNGIYMDMLQLLLPLREAVDTGVLPGTLGSGHIAYVTRDDLAAAGAAVLATGGHDGQILDLTGPQPLDHAGIAAALAEATGRPVRHDPTVDEPLESFATRLPPPARDNPDALRAGEMFWRSAVDGWADVFTHHIPRLTGRPGTTLAEFLRTAL
ncbi:MULTISPECIES: NAD(P)H-binding protein [unclassified Crossiella]|uniref:NAD(P)H-binding protein n=1 Tax=unclassified Crossiella TaxID=2620835 RepID=UPI00200035F1|nr:MULTISPECIES: NAD(P)H-binding protein [unclassified Crossiella]MCK2244317.1 NAD(P)H-binding protein [Crossiella sp. S99.2]MCK2257855.1 NAD(P)H-binding protein [Crossiella sp. S99.1]